MKYILSRLNELSTYRGIVFILTSFGIANFTPDQEGAVTALGLALAGVIGVFFPDKIK